MNDIEQFEHKAMIDEESNVLAVDGADASEASMSPVIEQALSELVHAFEGFKVANNERLSELERRGAADVITVEKLARLNEHLDKQQRCIDSLANNALHHSAVTRETEQQRIHKQAFETYMRKGTDYPLLQLESKAMSGSADAEGGYLVPDETERNIVQALRDRSPIRAISSVQQISSSSLKRPFAIGGSVASWVGEASPRPETASPQLVELSFPTMELFAMPAATSTLLDDAAIDIDTWLAEEVQTAFASAEGQAFVNGDGINRPRGFLGYPVVANAAWSWGSLGAIDTGVDGGFDPATAADCLIDLVYALKSGYRANARFLMNRLSQAEVRKLRDADGNYLWQPATVGQPEPSLMGFPVTEADEMPDVATGSLSIAFGDFKRGYLVVDRAGTRVLRDRFTAKPYVLFYTTKRVGGGVQDFEAIKLLRFAA